MNELQTDTPWLQVSLWFDDWPTAEQTAVNDLRPWLTHAEDDQLVGAWWFLRKGKCWRLRYLPTPGRQTAAINAVHAHLRGLADNRAVQHWAATIYEPETHAFGGPVAMDIAHTLFHRDSRHILGHLTQARPDPSRDDGRDHRREVGLLLASTLLRAAGQDWYEQGDIWRQVAAHRTSRPISVAELDRASSAVRTLITARTAKASIVAPDWSASFDQAGHRLAELAAAGDLTRGLRAVLAHHILFAWNRAGIPADQQAHLAAAATRVIFQVPLPDSEPAVRPAATSSAPPTPKLSAVTTDTTDSTIPSLRGRLIETLQRRGGIQTAPVEAAFHAVPRHLFLPGVEPEEAYAPRVVVTKRDTDGTALSSASHPNLVAWMLEQLDVRPGYRVLEIGTATGINAALLAELVGENGQVTTIEIDEDLAAGADAALKRAGYPQVTVVCADGATGYPPGAPYDRIIVTAGAWDLATTWWHQLSTDGRIVVPLILHGSGLTRSIAFDRTNNHHMASSSVRVCGFVDMRGTLAASHHTAALADDLTLHLDPRSAIDDQALRRALTGPPDEHWTNILIADGQPTEHLDLWLTTAANGFGRLAAGPKTRQTGIVPPTPRWGGAALHRDGSIAYLVLRELDERTEELGVIAYGTAREQLAEQLTNHLDRWNHERPHQPVITAQPVGQPADTLPPGYRIEKSETRLNICWQRHLS